MGLDMYGYAVNQNGEQEELQYWRKHPNLHGWMEQKWIDRGRPVPDGKKLQTDIMGVEVEPCFNCIPLELFPEDIAELEQVVITRSLPLTAGFFFGWSSDDDFEDDTNFILKARQAFAEGKRVFYDSWW